jgi:uncharacterized protein YmfQ (DUF2313 family)
MPIVLRASAADNNPAGAAGFVSFARPSGVTNGDTIVVGIAIPGANVSVTPQSADWTPIARTDPSLALGVAAFYKTALNEPTHWVFALSAPVGATGAALVYGGVDSFAAVEASAAGLTAASASHSVAAITASLPQEEEILFLGAAASGSYTPSGGFLTVARKQQAASTLEAQRLQLQNAGPQPAFTEAFSSAAIGASLRIVLRPSFGSLTVDDVYRRLIAALPAGAEDVYDLTRAGDYYRFYSVIAAALKTYSYDQVDLLRREIVPQLSQYKLPDWERVFGIETSQIAQQGTVPERQAQIVAGWRAAAGQGSSIPVVQAVLGPLLGYDASTPVQVIEANRAALKTAHTYHTTTDVAVPGATITRITIPVTDGGTVAAMGAQLTLTFATPPTAFYFVTLTAPDGKAKLWPQSGWNTTTVVLYGPELANAQIAGNWHLEISRASGAANTLLAGSSLFVEGIAPRQETAGAMFTWGVYADPAHVGESGTPGNFDAAQAAIDHIAYAYTHGFLIVSLAPWPDVSTGANSAIPDRCLPV